MAAHRRTGRGRAAPALGPRPSPGSKAEESTAAAVKAEVNEETERRPAFAIRDNNLMDYIDANDMAGKFQESYPNVNIEVEKIKDDSEY